MAKNDSYYYFLEGECEEHIFPFLKKYYIKSGKKMKLNLIQNKISKAITRTFKSNTVVVIVFDTDTSTGVSILEYNIAELKKEKNVKDIILIPQVKNFEDELKKSTNIRQIKEFTGSLSNSDFKRDFLKITNLESKFKMHKFDIKKFWASNPTDLYQSLKNMSEKIKL
jgi:hypothetical protein